LDAPAEAVAAATRIDLEEWEQELEGQAEWFRSLGKTLPAQLELQRQSLLSGVRGARRQAAK
ncbi:MAG TPA: hypothetical protein VH880_08485, partial [Anaeromyxobacteraceae bacterium]